jgi:1,4-dihydroxy-2-naphthoate polyprenyltransferase
MSEPTIATLGGDKTIQIARRYFLATRPKFFTASVLPMLLGSAWGWIEVGAFDAVAFIFGLASTVFVHASANVLNDVFDGLNGNDSLNDGRIFPFTGGSRFIQNGVLDTGQMAKWGCVLLFLGALCGLALTAHKGADVIWFGVVGVGLGILYSAPPLHLSARGLGELAVGVAFGTLPMVGAAWLQTGQLNWDILILSVPVSMWVTAILLINEVPDATADAAVDRRTLVVRFGAENSRWIYLSLHLVAFLAIAYAAISGLIPLWGMAFPAVMLLGGIKASSGVSQSGDLLRRGIEMTLALHMLGCLWMLALIIGKAFWW